ncbi:MAG TPA: cellulose binding domain-containing protein, partial [Terriglobales bacterium]|nr:cellulose binding domain-containing protein [Terriglobales bacterium]
ALSGGGGGGNGGTCSVAPFAPSGLAALALSSGQINLTWTAAAPPSGCSITHNVFRSTTSGFTPSPSNQIVSGLTVPSFTNTGLEAATAYYYKVEALDASGSSPASTQASATTQQPASGGLACHVAYNIVNQWNTGFQAAITIENIGTVNITSWTLKWTFPGNQQLANLWNGSYSQTSSTVMVNNLSYNGTIPAGGKYNGMGFTANFTGTNSPPTNFSVNGTICH